MEHRLPYTTQASGLARRLASDHVLGRLAPQRADDFLLMVSEVVSNAVRHGEPEEDGQIGLRLEGDDSIARAVVSDGGPQFQYPTSILGKDQLGLLMVDRLADRWGVTLDGRKAVWFEVGSGGSAA